MPTRSREPTPIQIPTGFVTAITPSPHAAGRFDLMVDGEPVCRLSIDGVERLGLRVGGSLGEASAAAIASEAEATRTYDRAIAMLAARGRATGELKRLLVRKGETPCAVDIAITRLQSAGFLDDATFARQFIRYRAVNLGLSRRRIQGELTCRGIDRIVAATAIAEIFADEGVNEMSLLEQAAVRKLRTMARLDEPTRRRRLYAFLARRGFDADAIGEVVRRLTKEGDEPV